MASDAAGRPLGVNTYGYIWSTPLRECLGRLRRLGYIVFEPVVNPPHLSLETLDDGGRRALRRFFEAEGIRASSLNLPSLDTNLASPFARMRSYSVEFFTDALRLASDLGIPRLVVVPGRVNPLLAPPMELREAWMRESLERLIPFAEALGVGLALENVPFASFPDAATLGAFARSFGSKVVSVCYDVANAWFIGEPPAQGLRALRELVTIVHLSDTTQQRWRHDEVGTGNVPFDDVGSALDEIGFRGTCMLEIVDPAPEPAILRSHARLEGIGFAARPLGEPA